MAFRFTVVGSGGEKNEKIDLLSGWVLGGPEGSRRQSRRILRCLGCLLDASGHFPNESRKNPKLIVSCNMEVSSFAKIRVLNGFSTL